MVDHLPEPGTGKGRCDSKAELICAHKLEKPSAKPALESGHADRWYSIGLFFGLIAANETLEKGKRPRYALQLAALLGTHFPVEQPCRVNSAPDQPVETPRPNL